MLTYAGVNCLNYPTKMFWDKVTSGKTDAAKAARRTRSGKAGCGGANRCSKVPFEASKAYQCDEFPFASVDPQYILPNRPINRCVETAQNTCMLQFKLWKACFNDH